MFEYLNMGAFWVITFIFVVLIFIRSKDEGSGFFTMLFIMYGLLFYDAYSVSSNRDKTLSAFKNDKALKCTTGGGLYSSATQYKVSKDDGWSIDGVYYTKDSLMVAQKKCELL